MSRADNLPRRPVSVPANSTAHPIVTAMADERVRLSLSQRDLAELADKPQPSIQNWERGDRHPNIVKFLEVAHALAITVTLTNSDGDIIYASDPEEDMP